MSLSDPERLIRAFYQQWVAADPRSLLAIWCADNISIMIYISSNNNVGVDEWIIRGTNACLYNQQLGQWDPPKNVPFELNIRRID